MVIGHGGQGKEMPSSLKQVLLQWQSAFKILLKILRFQELMGEKKKSIHNTIRLDVKNVHSFTWYIPPSKPHSYQAKSPYANFT